MTPGLEMALGLPSLPVLRQGDLPGTKSNENVRFLPSYTKLMLGAANRGKSDE